MFFVDCPEKKELTKFTNDECFLESLKSKFTQCLEKFGFINETWLVLNEFRDIFIKNDNLREVNNIFVNHIEINWVSNLIVLLISYAEIIGIILERNDLKTKLLTQAEINTLKNFKDNIGQLDEIRNNVIAHFNLKFKMENIEVEEIKKRINDLQEITKLLSQKLNLETEYYKRIPINDNFKEGLRLNEAYEIFKFSWIK